MSLFGPSRAHKATRDRLRTALQILLGALGVVAVVAGLVTVFAGTDAMPGDSRATANVESELRFYATFWTGFGVLALYAARRPERETTASAMRSPHNDWRVDPSIARSIRQSQIG